ncbi:hypothetical protein AURDEDRAFT_160105 [Auricularia subglabra TFB-10046 SS5]|nr:hypothetical protein AURDEDRAFT_160105 [Auricularia subglabra TFB-10046 SS5]
MADLVRDEAEIARADAPFQDAEANCASIKRFITFDPEFIEALPSELLMAIFTALFESTDWSDITHALYSFERRIVPYRLGSVCRSWRRLVRAMPELWTYIATPPVLTRHRTGFMDHVRFQLHQSRLRPLQLVLLYNVPTMTVHAAPEFSWFVELFEMLAQSAYRWGRVKIIFPPQMRASWFEGLMAERQTPLLDELFIGTYNYYHNEPDFDVLAVPWARGLRRLCAAHIALRFPSALLSVEAASIDVTEEHGYEPVVGALAQLPRIRHLWLGFDCSPYDSALSTVRLPELVSLVVSGLVHYYDSDIDYETPVTCLVSAPQLKELSVRLCDALNDARWGQIYVAAFPNITDLEFVGCGTLLAADAATFGGLVRLQRLEVHGCAFREDDGEDSFWLELSGGASGNTSTTVWPQLECLRLHGCSKGEGADSLLSGLAVFVQGRCDASNARRKPLRLSFVNWPAESFHSQSWLALSHMQESGNLLLEN